MDFYDLSNPERINVVAKINAGILNELNTDKSKKIAGWFSNDDTYIRKSAYLAVGRIFCPVFFTLLNKPVKSFVGLS